MRFLTTLILLSSVSFIFAQDYNSGNKIDEQEKKRLENQFKALKTFYIDDQGLVVYQKQDNNSAEYTDYQEETSDRSTTTEGSYNSQTIDNTDNSYQTISVIENTSNDVEYSSSNNTSTTDDAQPSGSTGLFVNKKPIDPVSTIPNKEVPAKNVEKETQPVTSSKAEKSVSEHKQTASTETSAPSENKTVKTSSKKSVFDKKPSRYKTMEEAALAVESLLEDLKKEQVQSSSNSKSMSSRLSRGAGNTSLRKKPTSGGYIVNEVSAITYPESSSSTIETIDNSSSYELEGEPTYYINGRQVDKLEITKLKKKNIINREIKTRNTTSGNPNGEIWYEVSYDE